MAAKNKRHFLLLASFFAAATLLGLVLAWGYPATSPDGDMVSESMGTMMLRMHGGDVTFADGVVQAEAPEADGSQHQSHHSRGSLLHYATTGVIIFCLPWIVAGTAFLLVSWAKP